MNRLQTLWPVALAALFTLMPRWDETTAPRQDPGIAPHLTRAQRAWDGSEMLVALDELNTARRLVQERLEAALADALPEPPPGFTLIEPREVPDGAAPGGAAFAPPFVSAGPRTVERRFRAPGGDGLLRVQVLPRSTRIAATRKAMRQATERDDTELLEAGPHLVLVQRGSTMTRLRLVLDDAHLVEVQAFGVDQETAVSVLQPDALSDLQAVLR